MRGPCAHTSMVCASALKSLPSRSRPSTRREIASLTRSDLLRSAPAMSNPPGSITQIVVASLSPKSSETTEYLHLELDLMPFPPFVRQSVQLLGDVTSRSSRRPRAPAVSLIPKRASGRQKDPHAWKPAGVLGSQCELPITRHFRPLPGNEFAPRKVHQAAYQASFRREARAVCRFGSDYLKSWRSVRVRFSFTRRGPPPTRWSGMAPGTQYLLHPYYQGVRWSPTPRGRVSAPRRSCWASPR